MVLAQYWALVEEERLMEEEAKKRRDFTNFSEFRNSDLSEEEIYLIKTAPEMEEHITGLQKTRRADRDKEVANKAKADELDRAIVEPIEAVSYTHLTLPTIA